MSTDLLQGKHGLIFGVANKRSIAWSIAQAASSNGAQLAFTYLGDKLKSKVEGLTATLPQPSPLYPCDVTKDEDIERLGASLREDLGTLDFVVHSIAFADRNDLEGKFLDTSRAGYQLAQEISSYSLTAVSGGLTVTEVAGELGISERTVKADWMIARARLRRILAQ